MTDTPDATALSNTLKQHIRDVPDFPTEGIMFRDISTLLADPEIFRITIEEMAKPFSNIDKVVIIESRGFILGTPIAYAIGAGVVPVRKPGRLPFMTFAEDYSLEYGTNSLEIHQDAITPGEKILIVDDLLATGGTVGATIKLVQRLGGEIVGIAVLAELSALNGRARIDAGIPVHSLVIY
ncbi:MAG: adenine phosphoribosyltransferase [Thermomicrobiales bacterium]